MKHLLTLIKAKRPYNTMKNLILSLLTVIVIASCASNTGPDYDNKDFEPYRIGSFIVTSETSADFVGSNSKAKTIADVDSVVITSPDEYQLSIVKDSSDEGNNQFGIVIVDSSFTQNEDGSYNTGRPIIFNNDTTDLKNAFSGSGGKRVTDNFATTFRIGMSYHPSVFSGEGNSEVIYVPVIKNNTDTVKTYTFIADGFVETVQSIL